MITVFGIILVLSRRTGFILVEIFLLLKLEREDGFCWEKPLKEINRNSVKDRSFTDFKQYYFTNLKIKRFSGNDAIWCLIAES